MALEQEEIIKKATTFFKLGEKYGILTEEIIAEMSDKIIKSPASLKYGVYEGGLIEFILDFMKIAVDVNECLPEDLKANKESLIKVAFLTHLAKYQFFQKTTTQWKIEKGQLFEYVPNQSNIGAGARAAKFALEYGIKLTDEEYSALISVDEHETGHDNNICLTLRYATKILMRRYGK